MVDFWPEGSSINYRIIEANTIEDAKTIVSKLKNNDKIIMGEYIIEYIHDLTIIPIEDIRNTDIVVNDSGSLIGHSIL